MRQVSGSHEGCWFIKIASVSKLSVDGFTCRYLQFNWNRLHVHCMSLARETPHEGIHPVTLSEYLLQV